MPPFNPEIPPNVDLNNPIEREVSKFFSKIPDTESASAKAKEKEMDMDSPNLLVHTTKGQYLFDILRSGLLSSELATKFLKREFSTYGKEAQKSMDNLDLISVTRNTVNSPSAKNQLLGWHAPDRGTSPNYLPISFIYNAADFPEKFVNVAWGDSGDMNARIRKKKISKEPLRGMWQDEYLVKRKIENHYIRGIFLGEEILRMDVDEVVNYIQMQIEQKVAEERVSLDKEEAKKAEEVQKRLAIFIDAFSALNFEISNIVEKSWLERDVELNCEGERRQVKFFDGVITTNDGEFDKVVAFTIKRVFSLHKQKLSSRPQSLWRFISSTVSRVEEVDKIFECIDTGRSDTEITDRFLAMYTRLLSEAMEKTKEIGVPHGKNAQLKAIRETIAQELRAEFLYESANIKERENTLEKENETLLKALEAIRTMFGNISIKELMTRICQKLEVPLYCRSSNEKEHPSITIKRVFPSENN